MAPAVLLHGGITWPGSIPLLVLVTVAAIGTALLLGLAMIAFVRRQSQPYFLIAAAFAVLLGRSAVVGLTLTGVVSVTGHHHLEHGLDVVLVALVVAAVYHSRTTPPAVQQRS